MNLSFTKKIVFPMFIIGVSLLNSQNIATQCTGISPLAAVTAVQNQNVNCQPSSSTWTNKYRNQSSYIPNANTALITLNITLHIFTNSDGTALPGGWESNPSAVGNPALLNSYLAPMINGNSDRFSVLRSANYAPSFMTSQYLDSKIQYSVTNVYYYPNTSLYYGINATGFNQFSFIETYYPSGRLEEGLPIIISMNGKNQLSGWNNKPAIETSVTYYDPLFFRAALRHEILHCFGLGHIYQDHGCGGGNGGADWAAFASPCGTNDYLSDVFVPGQTTCEVWTGNCANDGSPIYGTAPPSNSPCNSCYEKIAGINLSNNVMSAGNMDWFSPLQMGRRIRAMRLNPVDLGLPVNPLRSFAADLPSDHTNTWNITANETWDFDIQMYEDIVVKTGNTLTIKCRVNMAKEGVIKVEKGAKLVIDGGEVTTWSKSGRWQGVQLHGTSSLNQNYSGGYAINQGMINIINGGTIRDAEIGVFNGLSSIGSPFFVIGGTTGGVILADNANFINNVRDVVMVSYSFTDKSYFNNCNFRTTGVLKANALPLEHVNLAQVTGINFTRCKFEYLAGNTFNINQRRTGIYASDATFRVDHVCNNNITPCTGGFTKNIFNGLSNGIYIENTNPLRVPVIANTDFNNIIYNSTYAMNINSFIYEKNNINGPGIGSATGLYLNQCKLYNVRNNIFNNSVGSFFNVGVASNNSTNGLHQIYRNTFSNLFTGILAMNNNSGSTNNTDGLRMNCNDFTVVNNAFDISLTQSSTGGVAPTVMTNQGMTGNFLTFVRNRYAASCGGEQKWGVQGISIKSYNHPTTGDAQSRPDLPNSTCKDPLLNVLNGGGVYSPNHCPETQSSGGGGGGGGSSRIININNSITNLATNEKNVAGRFIYNNPDLQGYYAEKLNYYLTDSLEANNDSVIAVLLDVNNPMPDKDELLTYAYLNNGQIAKARQQSNKIASNNPDLSNFQNALIDLTSNKTYSGIGSNQSNSSKMMAANFNSDLPGVKVLNKLVNKIDYYIPRELPKLENGSDNLSNLESIAAYNLMGKYDVIVYPNPSNTFINYQFTSEAIGVLEVNVFDTLGKLVYETKSKNGEMIQISMQELPAGVYHLVCKNGKTVVDQQKLVKIN